jgi:hypothetical protein
MPYYIDPTKPVGGIVLAVVILVVGLFLNSIFGPSIHKAFWAIWDRIFRLFPASYQEHVESVASLPMDRVIDFYIGYLTAELLTGFGAITSLVVLSTAHTTHESSYPWVWGYALTFMFEVVSWSAFVAVNYTLWTIARKRVKFMNKLNRERIEEETKEAL